jgi:hypothetical protein
VSSSKTHIYIYNPSTTKTMKTESKSNHPIFYGLKPIQIL